MKMTVLLFLMTMILCGCSSSPSVEIQCTENGVIMTNEYSLRAEQEVICSHMVLRKVVDILGLSKSWGISPKDAVNRLRESLILTADRSKGTIRIKLKGFITKDAAMIINTICEQIPKNQENISDPTPVISFTPDGFDLDKHPDRFPLSENAQTNQTKVIVIRKAE